MNSEPQFNTAVHCLVFGCEAGERPGIAFRRWLAPFTIDGKRWPKGAISAFVKLWRLKDVAIPHGWRPQRGMSNQSVLRGKRLGEVAETGVEELVGRGVSVAMEANQRGHPDHLLSQPYVVQFDDGLELNPEWGDAHPWQGGRREPFASFYVRGDLVEAISDDRDPFVDVMRIATEWSGVFFGFVDAFRLQDTLCGIVFGPPYGQRVDPEISEMMRQWLEPGTDRRRKLPAVFWGNLWGPGVLEQLGVPVEEFVCAALGSDWRDDWIVPRFERAPRGCVFWAFTQGTIGDVVRHKDRNGRLLIAKRRVTAALLARGVMMSDTPWIGPGLSDDDGRVHEQLFL